MVQWTEVCSSLSKVFQKLTKTQHFSLKLLRERQYTETKNKRIRWYIVNSNQYWWTWNCSCTCTASTNSRWIWYAINVLANTTNTCLLTYWMDQQHSSTRFIIVTSFYTICAVYSFIEYSYCITISRNRILKMFIIIYTIYKFPKIQTWPVTTKTVKSS